MKGFISILLLVVMLVGNIGVGALASVDVGMTNAIIHVKSIFEIPSELNEFDYYLNSFDGTEQWYFMWSNKDKTRYIHVSVDKNNRILSFYDNQRESVSTSTKFPLISVEEGQIKALDFISKVGAGKVYTGGNVSKLDYRWELKGIEVQSINSKVTTYNFAGLRNGIIVTSEAMNVAINNQTGEVLSFSQNVVDGVSFPSPINVISKQKAIESFKTELGLKLTYLHYYDYDKKISTVYLVYTPINGGRVGIDAITGEKVDLGFFGPFRGETLEKSLEDSVERNFSELTPEERIAVDEVKGIISLEEAQKLILETELFRLDERFELVRSNLYRSFPGNESFRWNLSYSFEVSEGEEHRYYWANVTLDAKNGEIVSYSFNDMDYFNTEAKYDRDKSLEVVDAYLRKILPSQYSNLRLDESFGQNSSEQKELPQFQSFRFVRTVNGIDFEENGVTISFDAVNGRITSYNISWYNLFFESLSGAMDIERAYQNLFDNYDYELRYEVIYNSNTLRNEGRLAYVVVDSKPIRIKAKGGQVLNYDLTTYKEIKPYSYSDITNHPAKDKIEALAAFRIGFGSARFNPSQNIKEIEFLELLLSALGHHVPAHKDERYYQELVNSAILRGIISDSSGTQKIVDKNTATVYIVRALELEDVAKLEGIFRSFYEDVDLQMQGFVAIAKGFKIVDGEDGSFNGSNSITRAEAAVMIFNLLKR